MGGILYDIALCFEELDFQVELGVNLLSENPPYHDSNILCCWIQIGEVVTIEVKVFMVELLQDMLFDKVAEQLHVKHEAGLWIGLSGQGDDHFVVVAMEVGIAAFPEHKRVFLVRPVASE
jgi:hypothetical protein